MFVSGSDARPTVTTFVLTVFDIRVAGSDIRADIEGVFDSFSKTILWHLVPGNT